MRKMKINMGITFNVDGQLSVRELELPLLESDDIIRCILSDNKRIVKNSLASSIEGEKLLYLGADSFFQTILQAFCWHRSLVLSPDMIWLKILQTVSRHVNAEPERYRHLTSVKQDKRALVLESQIDIFADNVDWQIIIDGFENMISNNVENNFSRRLIADFSTTTSIERIASQITIMDAVKPFFEFVVHHMICGIPQITLMGTTEDWISVAEKVNSLTIFEGLKEWTEEIKPILQEFVNASEGNVNKRFWRDIVMKRHPKELYLGGCAPEKNPVLNGWILKFYPFDHDEKTLAHFNPNLHMKSEMVDVNWKYVRDDGHIANVYPMEFWAGFLGTQFDNEKNALIPKIGWFVRREESDSEIANEIDKSFYRSAMHLLINGAVPTFLKELKTFDQLILDFGEQYIELPDWLDELEIGHFYVWGRFKRGDKTKLRVRFKNIRF